MGAATGNGGKSHWHYFFPEPWILCRIDIQERNIKFET
jgi:hypothetical protein